MMLDRGLRKGAAPAFASSFIGRAAELAAVERLVDAERLVTLVGPGGCGKTRLAVEVLVRQRLCGFVELAAVAPGTALAAVVLAGCGVRDEPGRDAMERLGEHLGRFGGVLALDTCEHVRAEVARLVAALLRACPGLHVVATSRVSLDVDGEIVVAVRGLAAEDGAKLFLDRARRVQPALPADPAVEAWARSIYKLTDGLPLVIELAAAHARALPLEEIEAGMADRLRFLAGHGLGPGRRHESLLASIGWSVALIDPPARDALARLTVVHGRFTLDVALALVGPEARPVVETLVDHSLLQFDAADERYALLDTIRDYAAGELADVATTDQAHECLLNWSVELARMAGAGLGRAQAASLARVVRDDAAVCSALGYALRTGVGLTRAAEIIVNLAFSWSLRGRCAEGRKWAESLGVALVDPVPGLGWATAFLTVYSGDLDNGFALAVRAIEDASAGARYRARSMILVGMVQMFVDPAGAGTVLTEAAELADAVGDDWGRVEALQTLACTHLFRTDHASALECVDAALPAMNRLEHGQLRAWDHAIRADVAVQTGLFSEACRRAHAGLVLAVGIGEPVSAGAALLPLVRALCAMGRVEDAAAAVAAHVPFVHSHPGLATAEVLGLAAAIAAWGSEPAAVVGRLEGVLNGGRAAGLPSLAAEAAAMLAVARLFHNDAPGAMAAADEALQWAGVISNREIAVAASLARCAADRKSGPDTAAQAHQALADAAAAGLRPLIIDALDLLAGIALDAGRPTVAVRLNAATGRLRGELSMGASPLARLLRQAHAPAAGRVISAAGRAAAEAEGVRLSLEEAVAYATRSRGRRGRPSTGWDSLTPTEHAVAALTARGLSNPAIAAELLVMTGTVRSHLRSVFVKLAVTSRAELAAVAARRGL